MHNAVIDIPRLELFVTQLQTAGIPVEQFPTFKQILEHAIQQGTSAEQIANQVQQQAPAFSWFKDLLLPTNPGELYGFLSFVVALMAWWQSRKPQKTPPNVVINNFFSARDPYSNVGVNDPCPCGSGKKFKKCHGQRT